MAAKRRFCSHRLQCRSRTSISDCYSLRKWSPDAEINRSFETLMIHIMCKGFILKSRLTNVMLYNAMMHLKGPVKPQKSIQCSTKICRFPNDSILDFITQKLDHKNTTLLFLKCINHHYGLPTPPDQEACSNISGCLRLRYKPSRD